MAAFLIQWHRFSAADTSHSSTVADSPPLAPLLSFVALNGVNIWKMDLHAILAELGIVLVDESD